MKPESVLYIEKARTLLINADKLIEIQLIEDAGRAAYLAAFHAAKAFLFMVTDSHYDSHKSVRAQFGLYAKKEPRIERWMTKFLAQSYKFKEIADYGLDNEVVFTVSEAMTGIKDATQFVDRVIEIISAPPYTPLTCA